MPDAMPINELDHRNVSMQCDRGKMRDTVEAAVARGGQQARRRGG
jgi:hypothetical protein